MRNGLAKQLFRLPLLREYGQFLQYIHQNLKIRAIRKSDLFIKTPEQAFIEDCKNKPTFLYLPWIKSLSNKLMDNINISSQYQLKMLGCFKDSNSLHARKQIVFFNRCRREDMRDILLNWLKPVANDIKGMLMTFDYDLLQREIINICQELSIQTILIPHESVFLKKDKYYFHPVSKANAPLCDYVLCWGNLQKEIFISRDYPEDRIIKVGSPKLDQYHNFQPRLTPNAFRKRAMLKDESGKIVLFAAQTLDFQIDQKTALALQNKFIRQLAHYCQIKHCSLILRCPPTQYNILDFATRRRVKRAGYLIDTAEGGYLFESEEILHHADLILSVNSTMLFEGLLMGKKVLSVKYFPFEDFWQKAGIPCVHNRQELKKALDDLLFQNPEKKPEVTPWAQASFSPGGFDGQSSERIRQFLESIAAHPMPKINPPLARVLDDEKPALDMVYIHSFKKAYFYLTELLPCKKLATHQEKYLKNRVDLIGILDQNQSKTSFIRQKTADKPNLYISPGPLEKKAPWSSILIDDIGFYYDAQKTTRLQQILNSGMELAPDQIDYAQQCMETLLRLKRTGDQGVKNKLSLPGEPERKKILLLDESKNSPAVQYGFGCPSAFTQMLNDALINHYDADILIQPDNYQQDSYGKKFILQSKAKAIYQNEMTHSRRIAGHRQGAEISAPKKCNRVYYLQKPHNNHDLFEKVEEVYTVSALLGFEALMAGKKLNCYGAPFYANRGLSQDILSLNTRTRERSLLDIFYVVYIQLSRYYNNKLGRKCGLLEYIGS